MVSIRPCAALLALSCIAGGSLAQPATNAPATAASATRPGPGPGPGPGMGPGPGPGARRGPMAGFGSNYTPGWSMMTPAEREQHRQQMHSVSTAAECQRVRDEHRKLMTERAKAQGISNMPGPPRDACASFPR